MNTVRNLIYKTYLDDGVTYFNVDDEFDNTRLETEDPDDVVKYVNNNNYAYVICYKEKSNGIMKVVKCLRFENGKLIETNND